MLSMPVQTANGGVNKNRQPEETRYVRTVTRRTNHLARTARTYKAQPLRSPVAFRAVSELFPATRMLPDPVIVKSD